jgi:hypothetical protein
VNTAITIKGVIAQVILNVAEATFIHGKAIIRRPFVVYHAKFTGYDFWYTMQKFETTRPAEPSEFRAGIDPGPVRVNRVRHTLSGKDANDMEWTVTIILDDAPSGDQREWSGIGAERAAARPNTRQLAWGTEKFYNFVGYEFSGDQNIMANIMTLMRFHTKDTLARSYSDAD